MSEKTMRAKHEVDHGKMLALNNTELVWGWGTPAGKIRARRRAHLISTGAHLSPGVRALEIGCGTGLFSEMFAETGAHLLAVDISPELLQKARQRNLPEDCVQFVEKRFEECELEGPFDAIIGSSILHHLDLENALAKIFSLLKPGGVMSFAEPNMLNPQIFVMFKFRSFFPMVSPDEEAFVRWSLASILKKIGFEEIEITPFDWLHPQIPEMLIPLASGIGICLELLPCLRELAGSIHIKCRRPL